MSPSLGKKEQKILNQIARKKIKDYKDIVMVQEGANALENIPLGRTPKYETPEQMETVIQEYILQQQELNKPLTITGVALALGMDRKSLLNYSQKDDFLPIINKYRQLLLSSVEEALLNRNSFSPGQIFYLKNNYKQDYQDKIEVDNKHTGSISLLELSRLADTLPENIIEGELVDDIPQEDG